MSDVDPLSCQELVELVTDYLEDRLSPVDRQRFDAHLTVCPHCRAYVEQMRLTIQALGVLPPETIAPEATATLLLEFRRWKAIRPVDADN